MRGTPENKARSSASTAKAVVAALSLLVLGGVVGIAVDRHVLSSGRHSAPGDRHGHAAAFHEMAMSSLADRLDLEPAQRSRIDSILASRHHTLRRTWQTLHVELGAAVDTVHRDIEAVLTPEQRAAFREWLRRPPPSP